MGPKLLNEHRAVLKKTWSDWDHKLIRKVFTEVINQREVGSFSQRLLYDRTQSRPLLAIRQNAGLRHFCIGFSDPEDSSTSFTQSVKIKLDTDSLVLGLIFKTIILGDAVVWTNQQLSVSVRAAVPLTSTRCCCDQTLTVLKWMRKPPTSLNIKFSSRQIH